MKTNLSRNEKLVLAGLGICLIGFTIFMGRLSAPTIKIENNEVSQINYKMGKAVDETAANYDLSGRGIDREYEGLKNKDVVAKAATVSGATGVSATTQTAKSASATAQKKQQTAKTAPVMPRAPMAQINTNLTNDSETSNKSNLNSPANTSQFTPVNNTVQSPTDETKDEDAVVKKTYEQIRSEVLAAKTKESIIALVQSLRKNEVSTADFYQLTEELVNSTDAQFVGLGLYALRLTPSVSSFTMLVQYQSGVSTQYQTYIQESLISYNQSSQVGLFQQILKSNNKSVVLKAVEVIKIGFNEIKNGTFQYVDGRNRRDISANLTSVQSFNVLLPTLNQQLDSAQDNDIRSALEVVKNLINDNAANVAANN